MIKNKLFNEIFSLIYTKKVLDVGCIEHTADSQEINPFWVHGFFFNYSDVLGIDILREDIKKLRKKGYNIRFGDAETFSFKEKFDVVFAGELIEHLSNPGKFLDQSMKHLKKDGKLILTTPNTFYLPRLVGRIARLDDNPPVNPEHTCWFSPKTITSLLERHGFKVNKIIMFDAAAPKETLRSKVKNIIGNLISKKIKGSMLVIASRN